jgi:hypothetical protein
MDGPLGVLAEVRQQLPTEIKKMSMASPLGVAVSSLAAATTEDEEDVDGGLPGWCCQ